MIFGCFKQQSKQNRRTNMIFPRAVLILSIVSVSLTWHGSAVLDDYNISWATAATITVTPSASEYCGKMVNTQNSLYHFLSNSSTTTLQSWDKSSSETLQLLQERTFDQILVDFSAEYDSEQIAVLNANRIQSTYASINSTTPIYSKYVGFRRTPVKVFAGNNKTFVYSHHYTGHDVGQTIDIPTRTFDQKGLLGRAYGMAVTRDFTKAARWLQNSTLFLYHLEGTTLTQAASSNAIKATGDVTDDITFSDDNSLAIIETDHQNPIVVYNLTGFTLAGSFYINATIKRTAFINDSLILVVTIDSLYVINTQTSNVVLLDSLQNPFVTSEWDPQDDTLYLCHNNQISAVSFLVGSIIQEPTVYNPIEDPEVVIDVQMTQAEQQATEAVTSGLQSSRTVVDSLILVALSNPFAYYFISFVNFFTICSHYVLIDMPIPTQLYEYLSKFFVEVRKNLVARLWQNPLSITSQEHVTQNKLLSLRLTTDIVATQATKIIMAVINIILFQVIRGLLGKVNHKNIFKIFFYKPQFEILSGQFITLIMPVTSVWIFYIKGGVNSYYSKINLLLQYFLFGLTILFISYYLLQLIKNKAKTLQPRSKTKAQASSKKDSSTDSSSNRSIKMHALEIWYAVFSKFVYPLLLVTPTVDTALVALSLVGIGGVVIASRLPQGRLNKVVLACYPLLFHLCFVSFRITTDNSTLVYTQIACLSIILVGSVHQLLFMIYSLIKQVIDCCARQQVKEEAPTPQKACEPSIKASYRRKWAYSYKMNSHNSSKQRNQTRRKPIVVEQIQNPFSPTHSQGAAVRVKKCKKTFENISSAQGSLVVVKFGNHQVEGSNIFE